MSSQPILGIIGGSGLYEFTALKDVETIELDTPFGKPSSPVVIGTLSGKKIAFIARHGIGHFLSPSEVNYRANIFAFKQLGIQRVVGISACGSLREDYAPGHIVIPDQLVDFTRGRERTVFTDGLVVHGGVADACCSDLCRRQAARLRDQQICRSHQFGYFFRITEYSDTFRSKLFHFLKFPLQFFIISCNSNPLQFRK